jgi:hypothetical protein
MFKTIFWCSECKPIFLCDQKTVQRNSYRHTDDDPSNCPNYCLVVWSFMIYFIFELSSVLSLRFSSKRNKHRRAAAALCETISSSMNRRSSSSRVAQGNGESLSWVPVTLEEGRLSSKILLLLLYCIYIENNVVVTRQINELLHFTYQVRKKDLLQCYYNISIKRRLGLDWPYIIRSVWQR